MQRHLFSAVPVFGGTITHQVELELGHATVPNVPIIIVKVCLQAGVCVCVSVCVSRCVRVCARACWLCFELVLWSVCIAAQPARIDLLLCVFWVSFCVWQCVRRIERSLEEQGIYRIPGNSAQIQSLVGEANQGAVERELEWRVGNFKV